ncbi:MAG TPA: methylated-DNA--[protein]-cysteine S-methyltransferase [Candidatus Limnocylindrales bacterium]
MTERVAAWTSVPAPWGLVHLAVTESAVVALELLTPTERFVADLERRRHAGVIRAADAPDASRRLAARAGDQVEAYLRGSREPLDLPVDLGGRPEWDRLVLRGVQAIERGRVTSYGRLATRIGRRGAARAVGGAVGRNPIGLLIPCHRVIAGTGAIGGYGGDWWGTREALLDVKRTLLDLEGIALPVATFAD